MLCSKCFENIPQGKEIRLKCSTICKECALIERTRRKIVTSCIDCLEPIYEGDAVCIYKKSLDAWVKFVYAFVFADFKVNISTNTTKCSQCYKKWPSL